MTKHRNTSPKVWPDNPGTHFNPYYQTAKDDKRLHERGLENKIRWQMGERKKEKTDRESRYHEVAGAAQRKAPITLPTLKWMKP